MSIAHEAANFGLIWSQQYPAVTSEALQITPQIC